MTTAVLDEELIYRTRRRGRKLTPADRIAINLFRIKEVQVAVIARAFNVAKNTVYYKALGHEAESYPASEDDAALETARLIKKIGFQKAWEKYVTDDMIEAVNRENRIEAERRADALARRRAAE